VEAARKDRNVSDMVELITFHLQDGLFGIDILKVDEINKIREMTGVPRAPEYVLGVINLRGQIVTIVDLARKLGLESSGPRAGSRNIIVRSRSESTGLLVERVGDVVPAAWKEVSPPPPHVRGVQGKYLRGVFKTERELVAILDVDEVLETEP